MMIRVRVKHPKVFRFERRKSKKSRDTVTCFGLLCTFGPLDFRIQPHRVSEQASSTKGLCVIAKSAHMFIDIKCFSDHVLILKIKFYLRFKERVKQNRDYRRHRDL